MNPLNIVIYIKKNRSFSFMCRMSMCIMGCESIVILLTNIEIYSNYHITYWIIYRIPDSCI